MTVTRRLPSPDVERVPWEQLGPHFIEMWGRPGGRRFEPEHLTVYGKTGSGKTFFTLRMLRERAVRRGAHVVVVATKRADKELSGLGWPIVDTWPRSYEERQVIYWARAKGISVEHRRPQRAKVKALMNALWRPGANIIVYWDELPYIETDLGLKNELSTFYREGRSNGITNVACMQRPAGVSRLAHSEAGWTVAFAPKDQDDRKRVAEVLGDRARYSLVLDSLDRTKHEFLIKHDLTGEAYISHLPNAKPRRAVRPEHSPPLGYGVASRSNRDLTPGGR